MQIKKVLCGLMAATLIAASFAGCQNGGTSSVASTDGSSTDSSGQKRYDGTTITAVFPGSNWLDAVTENLDEFKEMTGITVEPQQLMNDQVTQKIAVSMAAGGSDIDVVVYAPLQNAMLYHQNGWIIPLDDYIANDPDIDYEDFAESSTELVTFDDGIFGVPYMTEREAVMYNKKMFADAGIEVPTTIEEMEAAAKALTTDSVAGITMRGKPYAAVTQVSSFIYSYGGDWIEDGKAVFNSKEAVDAIWMYGHLLADYGPVGSTNMDWQDTANIYNQGMAAMRIDCDSNYNYCVDPESSLVAEDTSMFSFPEGPAGKHVFNITAWALGISNGSQNKDAAWEFISWSTSKEMDVKTMGAGNPSARNSSWENEECTEAFPEIMVDVINETIPGSVGYDRPVMINVADARTEIGNAILVAIEGGSVEDVQAAADKAAENVQKLLDEEAAG